MVGVDAHAKYLEGLTTGHGHQALSLYVHTIYILHGPDFVVDPFCIPPPPPLTRMMSDTLSCPAMYPTRNAQMYNHHKYQEQQAKAQATQRMIEAGEMVPGANLTMDAQNEQQVRAQTRTSARVVLGLGSGKGWGGEDDLYE